MRDLVQVQVEDVQPVILGRRSEPDVPPHPARARQRRVEHGDRDVARADEIDLLLPGARRLQPQVHRADLPRHHEDRIEEAVQAVGEELAHHRWLVDAVHHHE